MSDIELKQEAYATHFEYLADLKAYIGKEIGLSPWTKISQDKINTFAEATEDFQWIHVNREMSKKLSPYKDTVAHGFLILSFASKFTYETYSVGDVNMGINYGLNKVRFPSATLADSLVRGRVSLLEYDEKPDGARFILKVVFEIKGQEKPACVAEFIAQAYVGKKDPNIPAPNEAPKIVKKEAAVLYRTEGKVAVITLNRPDRYNAVNDDVNNGLNDALRKARADDNVRAVVLTGAGKGFCSGADMESFSKGVTPEEAREYITTTYQTVMRNFFTLKKPIIGAINGTAAGVGASFALACDLRVMSEKSALLYAFINIGLGPDGGASWLLTRQVGYSRAMQISLDGEKIKGKQCLDWGLTNKLVEEDELFNIAMDWAKKLADKPTVAIGITKEDTMFALNNNLYDTVAFEAEKQMAAFKSKDLMEGVMAFIQKRKPKFIGK